MQKRLLNKMLVLSMLLGSTSAVYAADANSFRTDEYNYMNIYSGGNVLDTIRAADAYAKGYTGNGITVGVVDDYVNLEHPEFADKTDSSYLGNGPSEDYDWSANNHGTHVAGILAAAKNGVGMHGVAYAANIKSATYIGQNENYFSYYYDNPDIKILNNSWGVVDMYSYKLADEDAYKEYMDKIDGTDIYSYIDDAMDHDKLLIYAAGNEGHLMGGPESLFPYWAIVLPDDENENESENSTISSNLISVTAVSTMTYNNGASSSLTLDDDGGFTATPYAVAVFSDLAQFAEDWSVSAPGWRIYSANSNYANGADYRYASGTSMSTPIVSGMAALVQEAYPWLTAKQLGDVVLSTANNDIENEKGYYLTVQKDTITDSNGTTTYSYTFNIYYTGSADENTKTNLEILNDYCDNNADMKEYLGTQNFYEYAKTLLGEDADNDAIIDEAIRLFEEEYLKGNTVGNENFTYKIQAYYNVPNDVLYGQGIVDASKAVDGLAALNVRRMTKSDISEDYTINGETTKQALYKVDTQGYNAVWSNDISEIRAGKISKDPLDLGENADYEFDDPDSEYSDVEDLHDRYVFYTTNWGEGSDNSYMVQQYIKKYNDYYEEQGLIGLHAGFYKDGDGILVLAGENTYQGSTIAAGGVLQIDGSVAGDAWSIEDGTIAGAGTINGNLYNNGNVMAGQALEVTYEEGESGQSGNTLTVAGNMSGEGSITVNIFSDGTANLIKVTDGDDATENNTANISEMSLQAGTSAAPDVTVTFLTADDGITIDDSFADEDYTEAFSGLLNVRATLNDAKTKASLTTSANNNTGVHEDTANAVFGLYDSLENEQQQEMYTLFALDKADATTALNQLSGTLAEDMAHDAIQNRDVRTALREQEHLQRTDGLWMLLDKHWSRYDNTDGHGFTTTIGKDFFNNEKAYAGALFAYSTNTLSDKYDSGDYDNYTLGLYGGTKNAPGTWRGYISYGLQDNSVNRNLTAVGRTARADYDSSTLGAGVRYAYDLQYGNEAKANHWHSVPYAQLNYTHYKQDGYTEKGAGIYERQVAGYSDDYADGELGLEIKRTDAYGSYGFSVGYRRILTGEQQESTAFFTGDGTRTSFTSAGTAEEKDHVVVGAFIGTKFSDKWSAAGQLQQDWSSNSNELHVNVVFNYSF